MVINELRLSPHHETFGRVLKANDYDTLYIGKWHLWANELGNHKDPKNAFVPPGPYRLGFDDYWAGYNFWHEYYSGSYYENSPDAIAVNGYEPDVQTDLAIQQLRERGGDGLTKNRRPFALFLSYGTPHDPWDAGNVPTSFYDMFKDVTFPRPPNYKPENDAYADGWQRFRPGEREQLEQWLRVYYAMTANLDWNIGRLLKAVDEAGLRDDTIFVFTSDHGEMFGAHGRRAKNIFYDEAVRVPFLLRYPGRHDAGRKTDVCLNTPDIMPTLLSLMNLPTPRTVEGMDLSPAVFDINGDEPNAAFMQGMGCTADWQDGFEWRALRDKRYTYAVMHVDGKEFLFDRVNDPYQLTNLADDAERVETVNYFRDMLATKMRQLNDTFEKCTWYRDHWTENRIILRTATMEK